MERRSFRFAVKVIVPVAVLILGASLILRPPSDAPTATPGASEAALASASARPAPSGTPGATEEPWQNLGSGSYQPDVELTPVDSDRIGASPSTAFTLRSFTATPALQLAKHLVINPSVAFRVEAGPTPDTARIKPAKALDPSTRYRFRLESNGVVEGSWIYITRGPLHVTGTLPADKAVGVPVNTGIELTFDQDQTTGVAERFSIEPKTTGRFEQHGRVWSFVPDEPLAAATIYVVTLHKGVAVTGSDGVLEADQAFRFETSAPGPAFSPIGFSRSMLEVRPNEQVVATIIGLDENREVPETINVKVHRLPNYGSLVDAARKLTGRDAWAIASPSAVVETSGLTQVADVKATIISTDVEGALLVPVKLASGAYVLTLGQPGPPAQLLLQVTNLSAYAQVSTTATFVWVNDIANDAAIGGANVAIAGGATLGETGSDGLLQAATPGGLESQPAPVDGQDVVARSATLLTVTAPDGRRLLVPIGMAIGTAYGYDGEGWYGANADWFVAFDSGRTTFRRTDVASVFGVLRARSDRSVPSGVAIVLRSIESPVEAAIVRKPVELTSRGVFAVSMPIDDLPAGTYMLDLLVGGKSVSSIWIDVTEIRKPAYQIDVETPRHAFVVGESVVVNAIAKFFDGTAVPGVDLVAEGFDRSSDVVTTGSAGDISTTLPDASVYDPEGWSTQYLDVRPSDPEEGQITGEALVTVFPSSSWIAADTTMAGGKIVVDGKLSKVDLPAVEARLAQGLDVDDPAGAPIAGGKVRIVVTQEIPVRRKTGTDYDFIEKVVVPIYEYRTRTVELTSTSLTAGPDGAFHLTVTAPAADSTYQVVITSTDGKGRTIRKTDYVEPQVLRDQPVNERPYLGNRSECGFTPNLEVGLDEAVDATMHNADGSVASGGRFLFLVAEPGSVVATIQDVASFSKVLREADVPGFDIRAAWFARGMYFVAEVHAVVDPADKTLTITLTPDQSHYAPGDRVTIKVRTTDPSGQPIPADVILQGIDEKLYKLGYANDVDLLPQLLATPASGFLTSYRTHDVPKPDFGGCGDEGGGREDFSDTVTFQRISTGTDGKGTATFNLSDDLTSWRVSAAAVSKNLDAGATSVGIPVGLPFFVDATLAPEYLVGEDVVLRVRTYGDALSSGDQVHISVSAPTLGMTTANATGTAFSAVRVPLPPMTAGDHEVRIAADITVGGTTYHDALIRTVHVVTSRLGTLHASYDMLDSAFRPQGGDGLTRYVITDAGRGRLIAPLEELTWSTSARFDRATASELARRLLTKEFGIPESSFAPSDYEVLRWSQGGIALLPYSSADVFLSARAALLAPDIVDSEDLRDALTEWADAESSSTPEAQIAALAGLAALNVDVLDRLQSMASPSLTIREQLWLALGLVAAGDEAGARAIERTLLDSSGQRLGPWVRLHVGTTPTDTLEGSGLLLMLAVVLRDPIATDVSRYLDDHASAEVLFPLEQLAYTRWVLYQLPRVPGRFAWTVDGKRQEVTLPAGGSYAMSLTAPQVASLTMERLDGDLAVATSWSVAGEAPPAGGGVKITRTVTPSASSTDSQLVRVVIAVDFGAQAVSGCYSLTDLVPSGLAPIDNWSGWGDDGIQHTVNSPWRVDGQVVSWCATPGDLYHQYGYTARVVTPGTYRWEPAVIQSEIAPTIAFSTPTETYTIR
ncbi:MAG TPA: Ig-like domain-containing protein [Candidatus Limnocylindrales bacterium]|nr:Ig-like domain-containing protein [Candidatus Limnocylindrales bacterium]